MVFGVDDEGLSLVWSLFGLRFAGDAVVCIVEDMFDVFPAPTAIMIPRTRTRTK